MKHSFKIIVFSLSIALVIVAIIIFSLQQQYIENPLFNFSLFDVLNFIATVMIGAFFSYVVSISFQSENKKNEIIEETLIAAQENSKNLLSFIEQHVHTKINTVIRSHVLNMAAILSNDVNMFRTLCIKKDFMNSHIEDLLKKRQKFYFVVTGDAMVEGEVVSLEYIQTCIKEYSNLQQSLLHCKIRLFD